ncbi:beta strand repeat-containing protein, partial [Patescibacteria group bacterium]
MNKKHKFFLKSGILSLFAISFALSLAINYQQSMAVWGGDCAAFIDGGSLTVTAFQTCTLTGGGTATDVTVDSDGTLDLTSATLSVSGPVDIDGDLDIDGTSTLTLTSGDLTLANGGTVDNNGTINVDTLNGQTTRVENAASSFNNFNQINTRRLYVGQLPTEGGTYTNTGTTNITENASVDALNIYGGEIYNNNTGATTSFSWLGKAWINGISDVNQGRFENSGVVDGGQRAMNIVNYGKIDLKNSANSRFVLNNSGCAPLGDPEIGRIYLSGLDATHTVSFEIEDGAFLGVDGVTVGANPLSDDSLTNNGTIRKINTAGADLNCPVLLTTNGTSTITNNKDIDIHEGAFSLFDNSTVTNNASGSIIGELSGLSQIEANDAGTNFNNFGSLNIRSMLLGQAAGPFYGGTYTAKTGSTNNFSGAVNVGDTVANGGVLTIESDITINVNEVNLRNNGDINLHPTSTLEIADGFNLKEGATFTNDGEVNVGNITLIIDDGTLFTNNGTLDTYKMNVGALGLDGGEYDNYGITNIAYSSMSDDVSLLIVEGTVTNSNTNLELVTFSYDAKAVVEGTVAEQSVFRNFGIVDAGISDISLGDYALLDLQDGRFVLNSEGCFLGGPNNGFVRARSTTAPSDSLISIEAGALLSVDQIELGWDADGSDGQVNNEGTIDKTDLTGAPLDCPVVVMNRSDSIINNSAGGLIDLRDGDINITENADFNNKTGASITGINGSHIKIESDAAVLNQSGNIDVHIIGVRSNTAGPGAIFNGLSGSITNVDIFDVGNQSANLGGEVNINTGAQLTANNQIIVEGYGLINADGQIDATLALSAFGGNTDGGATINLRDTSDVYEFGTMVVDNAKSGYTSSINIDPGVEVHLTTPADPGFGYFIYGGVGYNPADGENQINVNGTLRLIEDPVNSARFIIFPDGNGLLNLGSDGFFDFDDADGQLEVTAPSPYGLIDKSDDLLTEGVDVEGAVIIDGHAQIYNRLDAVNLLHIQSGGEMHCGYDSEVTVEGSDTIIDGFYELDGTLNAGNLTVTGTGHLTSGDDPGQNDTNFLTGTFTLSAGCVGSDGACSSEDGACSSVLSGSSAGASAAPPSSVGASSSASA